MKTEPPELKVLRTGRPSERLKAAEFLLYSRSMWHRMLAMEALGRLPRNLAEPVLVKLLLNHPSPRVRMSALAVLSRYAGREHLEILKVALRSERYSGVRELLAGLVTGLERPGKPARGGKGRVVVKRRRKARSVDGRVRFFVTGGAVATMWYFASGFEMGAVIRLGLRYKWFEFDVDTSVVRESKDDDEGGAYEMERRVMVTVCPGLGFYSLRRSWIRIRHGFRVGAFIYTYDDAEELGGGGHRVSVAGWAHLVDIAFSPVKGLWFEVSPVNLGYPFLYHFSFHVRYEI